MLQPFQHLFIQLCQHGRAPRDAVAQHHVPRQITRSRALGIKPARVFDTLPQIVQADARQSQIGVYLGIER